MKQEKQSNKDTVIERRIHLSEYSPEEILERDRIHDEMRKNHELLRAVKTLNDFCDSDPRQPYYDVKKHTGGKSVYLTIRTKNWPQSEYYKPRYNRNPRKYKKFFGKTRHDVTIAAAQYIRDGGF